MKVAADEKESTIDQKRSEQCLTVHTFTASRLSRTDLPTLPNGGIGVTAVSASDAIELSLVFCTL